MNLMENSQVNEQAFVGLYSHAQRSRKLLCRIFEEIRVGYLEMTTPDGVCERFGDSKSQLRAHFIVKHPDCFDKILYGGSLGLGEAYMDGYWEVKGDRLVEFFGIILLNKLDQRVRENLILIARFLIEQAIASPRFLRSAQKSVMHHYDLSNDFFKLMLDQTMAYSCGYQQNSKDTLLDLQVQKYERIAKKLCLERGGLLLDIGCGWGGFLIYAAQHYPNISGRGITISPAQREFAISRISELGLTDRITVDLLDYRELQQKYDFIVSVGMFEHVGKASYRIFMEKLSQSLKEGGIGLLHTIGTIEPPEAEQDPWMATYIFPGYRLPRLAELTAEMQKQNLLIGHLENIKLHYATTLSKWRERINQNRQQIQELGLQFDLRFFRMWNYYLQCSEAGFCYGQMQVYQLLFSKGNQWVLPMNLEWAAE